MVQSSTQSNKDAFRLHTIDVLIEKFEKEIQPPYSKTANELRVLMGKDSISKSELDLLNTIFIDELKNEIQSGVRNIEMANRVVMRINAHIEKERKTDGIHVSRKLQKNVTELKDPLKLQNYIPYTMKQIPTLSDNYLKFTMAASLYFFVYEYLTNGILDARRILPERKAKIRNAIAHNSLQIINGKIKFQYSKPNRMQQKIPFFNQELHIIYYPDKEIRWIPSGSSIEFTLDQFLEEIYENYLYFIAYIRWIALILVIQRMAEIKRQVPVST